MVCGLLREVHNMKKVISSMFISTIGVKSTRMVIFFCLPFSFPPLSFACTSAIAFLNVYMSSDTTFREVIRL